MDPKARRVAMQIGGSRVALGTAIFLGTRPVLRAMRFPEPGPTGVALAKLGGGRDIGIGVLTLASLSDPDRLRTVMLASNLCDLADAAAFAFAARDPQMRLPTVSGVLSGSAAAAAGFWAWRRLGD
ncbi:MAG TPA: hypothetical protein VFN89_11440 [Solirubrobacterales bacterium]|nr:hypothetical protein [Solirubrobacterales bacterium]